MWYLTIFFSVSQCNLLGRLRQIHVLGTKCRLKFKLYNDHFIVQNCYHSSSFALSSQCLSCVVDVMCEFTMSCAVRLRVHIKLYEHLDTSIRMQCSSRMFTQPVSCVTAAFFYTIMCVVYACRILVMAGGKES